MRLPQTLLNSIFFTFALEQEFVSAFGTSLQAIERSEIERLAALQLPPITSEDALALMIGVNPGMIWSLVNRNYKYYDSFVIKKGAKERRISAPRVSMKLIQKWISLHLENAYDPPDHVYGFVAGRSHLDAASKHCEAQWIHSFDIRNFFQNTPSNVVENSLLEIGYKEPSTDIIVPLCTLAGFLAQGAPTSPVLSNMAFKKVDAQLAEVAAAEGLNLTRYADDIVFSGIKAPNSALIEIIKRILAQTPWSLAEEKSHFSEAPNRRKVHGLLVHGNKPRLTKGYRNRIRGFEHAMHKGKIKPEDLIRIKGHLNYAAYVEKKFI
ncbi:reverse transcriptase family protein [Methylobacterium sp. Leaf112]|uniref:reverse transcriptase family protein n=1 Tax=Methylobacterium sp. Leaf112 TaxID=1736258 RepID=UPI0009E6E8E7|nr:reverse transcriptase family protein [Methylobacterium sp. Leaf112]